MALALLLLSLSIYGLADAGQESVKLINLFEPHHLSHSSLTYTAHPVYISLRNKDLNLLSSAISHAENWLKTHIPAAPKPTTVVVGKDILCTTGHQNQWALVLSTMINMHHAIKNLGLEKHIKVSAAFSNDCLVGNDSVLKPVLDFLKTHNTPYLIDPPPHFSSTLDEIITLVSSHETHIRALGFSMNGINVIVSHFRENPMKRKLYFTSSKLSKPHPERPIPLPEPSPLSPFHPSFGSSAPSDMTPIPPTPQIAPPPPAGSFSFVPDGPPVVVPANPPDVPLVGPPCMSAGPSPGTDAGGIGEEKGLWCVAKPSVPSDVLQEAMDYACGEGGADCDEIGPHRSCYYPDTMVAHASYAFNSYWQKNKNNGGTCSFDGTAMIINADPNDTFWMSDVLQAKCRTDHIVNSTRSYGAEGYLHCHFILL